MAGFCWPLVHHHHRDRHRGQVCGQDLVGPYQIRHLLPSRNFIFTIEILIEHFYISYNNGRCTGKP